MRILLSLSFLLPRQPDSRAQGGLQVAESVVWKCWGGSQVLPAEQALVKSGCMNIATIARFFWAPKRKGVENRDKLLMG